MAKIAAIILAAGQSKRFGASNKLLANYRGCPLIDHCLNCVTANPFTDRLLVTGFEHEKITSHISALPIRTVHNPKYETGMGSSLSVGVKALKPSDDAFMVFLADMPDIRPDIIGELINAYNDNRSDKTIIRPVHKGAPGHPVLFAASYRHAMKNLSDDQGAVEIINKNKTSTLYVEVEDAACIRDIDRINDL